MTNNQKHQKATVIEYCKLIVKEDAKSFIGHYEYHLTRFAMQDVESFMPLKETEKLFISSLIMAIDIVYDDLKNDSEIEDDKDKEALLEEFSLSTIFLYRKFLHFLTLTKKTANPYKRIFRSDFAYVFFLNLKEIVVNQLADYSFIYRKMLEDGFIFESVGDSEFRHWLSTTYEIEIDKTKQLYLCTTNAKELLYSSIKSNIKEV